MWHFEGTRGTGKQIYFWICARLLQDIWCEFLSQNLTFKMASRHLDLWGYYTNRLMYQNLQTKTDLKDVVTNKSDYIRWRLKYAKSRNLCFWRADSKSPSLSCLDICFQIKCHVPKKNVTSLWILHQVRCKAEFDWEWLSNSMQWAGSIDSCWQLFFPRRINIRWCLDHDRCSCNRRQKKKMVSRIWCRGYMHLQPADLVRIFRQPHEIWRKLKHNS